MLEISEKDYLRGRGFWVMGARRRRSDSRRSTSSPMSRARAPVAFGGGSEARAPLQVCKRRFGGYAWAAARRGAFAIDFVTSTASSGALDALNAFGANPRGARRAMHSEGGERRDPTPKTARERAQSPRRRARDGDAGADVERLRREFGLSLELYNSRHSAFGDARRLRACLGLPRSFRDERHS